MMHRPPISAPPSWYPTGANLKLAGAILAKVGGMGAEMGVEKGGDVLAAHFCVRLRASCAASFPRLRGSRPVSFGSLIK